MKEKDKTPPIPIRFLHPENELFVEGKARFLAASDEVKRNIRLQIQSGEVPSGSNNSCFTMLFSLFIVCGSGMLLMFGGFVLVERTPLDSTMLMLLGVGALYFGVGITSLRPLVPDYFRYLHSENIEAIYTHFNHQNLVSGQIVSITPLSDVPYTHIAYLYPIQGRYGKRFVQGNYLAEQPIDLAQGDGIYVVESSSTKIIL